MTSPRIFIPIRTIFVLLALSFGAQPFHAAQSEDMHTDVVEATPAKTSDDGASGDKGLTCKERRERAQQQFEKECLPAFTGMTVHSSCQDMCRGNAEFATEVECGSQCTDCLSYLRTIEGNKDCKP